MFNGVERAKELSSKETSKKAKKSNTYTDS